MDEEKNILYALRDQHGDLRLYVDEDWASERGVDPSHLTPVEIPREIYASGTRQQLLEYVATYLESLENSEESSA
jgi:hypothetical protein